MDGERESVCARVGLSQFSRCSNRCINPEYYNKSPKTLVRLLIVLPWTLCFTMLFQLLILLRASRLPNYYLRRK